jgi:hypothetical protein
MSFIYVDRPFIQVLAIQRGHRLFCFGEPSVISANTNPRDRRVAAFRLITGGLSSSAHKGGLRGRARDAATLGSTVSRRTGTSYDSEMLFH